ncbi:Interstitial collagenase [Folsomia candida]|uniref:Interstitial collagenase n=1 Tax=Folsomia candida TaxID=158441 RepID=A0A226D5E1_FOLCA|nr:Interstitial collagenase [Folsomia candida]
MVENDTTAMMYLERFGYIERDDMPRSMEMKEAVPPLMAFQKMCGIDQTGELDTKTVEMMNTPRCGNKDMMRVPLQNYSDDDDSYYLETNRVQRYVLNQHRLKWTKRSVTYRMGMFSQEMQKHVTEKQVLDAIHTAFQMWSDVTNLDFAYRPKEKRVDIELSFTTRNHPQDGYPFDGPGQVLAHAFPPGESSISGDVHFEDEENWHVHSPKGTDVLFVAVHEIGHALGLSHSSTKGAIMAAFYGGYHPKLKLHQDDIDGIQAIYGKREVLRPQKILPQQTAPPPTTTTPRTTTTTPRTTTTTTTTTPRTTTTTMTTTPRTTTTTLPPTTRYWKDVEVDERWKTPKISGNPNTGRPDLCQGGKIDAITTLNDNKIYVFKGAYVFQISPTGEGVLPGWPNHIGYTFPGLETNLDAAATRENGKQILEIHRHQDGPWLSESYGPSLPWNSGPCRLSFRDKFWRFDPKKKPHVSPFYPLPTHIWGFRHGVDAAFTAPNGELYFFHDSLYYRLDATTFKIAATSSPPYPRSSLVSWFGCSRRPDFRDIRNLFPGPIITNSDDDYSY